MSPTRLEILKSMAARNPQDSFSRYGLAMEYRNGGDLEAAAAEFRGLLDATPDYVPAFYHYGQTLEKLGRMDQAGEIYRKGIETAARRGDRHAQSELQAALELLG